MMKLVLIGHIKCFFPMQHCRTGAVLILLVSGFLSLPIEAADYKGCSACHKEVLEEVYRNYVHVPFMQQSCGECHDANVVAPLQVKTGAIGGGGVRKISWLGESIKADNTHVFLIPGDSVEKTLVVEVQGSKGAFSRQEISVPPLTQVAEVTDNGKPPVITGVQVLKVVRGVFLSATIGWQTDTLTDARVHYGQKDLLLTAGPDKCLGRQHEVVLYNLEPNKTYHFSVLSRDLFGRKQASAGATFSTAKAYVVTPAALPVISLKSGEKVGQKSCFQRIGSDYLLELTLEKPASVYIGSGKVPVKSTAAITVAMGEDANFHLGLSSRKAATIAACRNCHTGPATATHPVNVLPKPGMIIPPEYPTLPDGRITCRSCHEPHSSEYEYLAVKEGKRALCVGCHLDML